MRGDKRERKREGLAFSLCAGMAWQHTGLHADQWGTDRG